MKKVLFIVDPVSSLNVKKDSSIAMMRASAALGFDVYTCEISDLSVLSDGFVCALVKSMAVLSEGQNTWYQERSQLICRLTAFDVVLMRKDPPFDMRFVSALWLLHRAVQQGARVLNSPHALLCQNEKLGILEFPELISPTLVSACLDQVKQFHDQHKDIILKPLDGMGGTGVFRVRDDGMNLSACVETLTDSGLKPLMAQRYIPAVVSGDRRVLVVHGQVIPFVLARMPQKGETRANLAAGGTGVAQAISDREREIAQTLAPILLERGIAIAGLDVIGDYLTEINITSPTCLVEIKQQTGFDVAHQLMVHWSS